MLGLFLCLAEGNLLQVAAKHVANSHQFCARELWSPYVFYFLPFIFWALKLQCFSCV